MLTVSQPSCHIIVHQVHLCPLPAQVSRATDSLFTDLRPMEGEAEDSDEGGEKATVIWEKCVEQSIFVDLSEDESLHLSDFENSLVLHLSQTESAASETSIHLNGEFLFFGFCLAYFL